MFWRFCVFAHMCFCAYICKEGNVYAKIDFVRAYACTYKNMYIRECNAIFVFECVGEFAV